MCDPVCEHCFRSCHTVYFILSMGDIGSTTVDRILDHPTLRRALITLRQLSMACTLLVPANIRPTTSRYRKVRRTQITLRHAIVRPLAIKAPSILVKLPFSLRCHFSKGVPPSHIPRIWKTARASYPKNAGDYPMGIHYPRHVTVAVLMLPAGKK